MDKKYYIGIMSGTSMDGVDLVLAEFSQDKPKVKVAIEKKWPCEIATKLHNLCTPSFNETVLMGEAANDISTIFAQGVEELLKQAKVAPEEVIAIGSHGQTIRHHPEKSFSWQIGNGALLAELTGIDVVCDFRSSDIAAGGEGAPLVPAFHNYVFRNPNQLRFIVNIGGISNISVLDPNKSSIVGFDTGPGNTLLDANARKSWQVPCDYDAIHAQKGKVNTTLLNILMAHPYLKRDYPKSTGRETFTWEYIEECLKKVKEDLSSEDLQRTLCAYTAKTIADQIIKIAEKRNFETYVCGGGCHNPIIMNDLKHYLEGCYQLGSTDLLGADPDFVEALAFAWLAYRFTHRLPGNLPEATGATKPKILGCLYPYS